MSQEETERKTAGRRDWRRNRCAVSGFSAGSLVEAAHILSWSSSEEHRLDTANGIALNALLHRAYDLDLLGISADGQVSVSVELMDQAGSMRELFGGYDGLRIDFSRLRVPPNRDFPDQRFCQYKARAG